MILSDAALCSIDDVRTYLLYDKSVDDRVDRLIGLMINGLSQAFEQATGRRLVLTQRTEYFSSPQHVMQFNYRVEAPPIKPGTVELRRSETRDFTPANSVLLEEGKNYVVDYDAGIISLVIPGFWDVGWDIGWHDPLSPAGRRASTRYGFPRTSHAMRVQYTGGLIVPRPKAPMKPAYSKQPGGVLNGKYRYTFSIVDADGVESAAVSPFMELIFNNEQVQFVFTDPGAGKKYIVYRSPTDDSEMYYLTELPGGSGPIVYTDNNQDSMLQLDRRPLSEGPLVVPDDLRLAAAQQVADWVHRGSSVTTITVDAPGDLGGRRYDGSKFTALMRDMITAYSITRS
jgi:hypothetical protein